MNMTRQDTDIVNMLDWIMKRILNLGQSSLSESQYEGFRETALDIFNDGKRRWYKGWSGDMQNKSKGGG